MDKRTAAALRHAEQCVAAAVRARDKLQEVAAGGPSAVVRTSHCLDAMMTLQRASMHADKGAALAERVYLAPNEPDA